MKLNIGYFADGPWGYNALLSLIDTENVTIAFLVPRLDTKDSDLVALAERNGIDVLHNARVNSEEFYLKAANYNCDLFVSMSFDQIMKSRIFGLPPMGTINCHAGKLPFYRGRNVLNWVLINDEREFGITVHYLDEGVDTGDIIMQEVFPIHDSDNYKSLLDKAYQECPRILTKSVIAVVQDDVNRIPQSRIDPIGTYFGKRVVGDEWLDWNQNSREVFNFIRAISKPGPGAHSSYQGQTLRIHYAAMVPNASPYRAVPGMIVGKSTKGYLVKTMDTVIEIAEIEPSITLRIGERLKELR